MNKHIPLFLMVLSLLFIACSGSEKQVMEEVPIVKEETVAPPRIDTRMFKYNERYFVRGALLAAPTNIDDPVQALRVIQLRQGAHDALIISAFDREDQTPTETWFGIEYPKVQEGRYDLAEAKAIQFFRFYLGEVRERFEGVEIRGSLTVESFEQGLIIGHIEAEIDGVVRSFEREPEERRITFSGSFGISEAALEDTMILGR